MISRRVLLATLAVSAPILARPLPRPDAEFKASAVNWPLPDGRTAHGYMAVPQWASGKQPAVLLIGDTGAGELDDRLLVRALAQAGFVACTLNRAPSADAAALRGTLGWLAGNRYATGKIALLGIAGGAAAVERLLDDHAFDVAAAIDPVGRSAWMQAAGTRTSMPAPLDWDTAWGKVTAFFREHLA